MVLDGDYASVHWYPGHMAKSERLLKETLGRVDLVIEVLDARIPFSSRNPSLDELTRHKQRLIVLSHADLADEQITESWQTFFREMNAEKVMAVDLTDPNTTVDIRAFLKQVHKPIDASARAKGRKGRPLRVLVAGIPNTGKSTLINHLLGRRSAAVEDRPGVTRHVKWLRVDTFLELLDSPGLLPPKLRSAKSRLVLAATGAIRDDILPIEDVAFGLFRQLEVLYPEQLEQRYKISIGPSSDHYDGDPMTETHQAYERYCRAAVNRGCVKSGGRADVERFARNFLHDFRSGRIGRLSLEKPESVGSA